MFAKRRSAAASKAKNTKNAVPLPKEDINKSASDDSTTEENERPPKRTKTSASIEGVPNIETRVETIAELLTDNPKMSREPEPAVKLTGEFDLYGMELPFLNKVYAPNGDSSLQPEELYKTILTYQAKPDSTAKISIPDNYATGGKGTFRSSIFCDPMEESPFDISITNIKDIAKLGFTSQYGRPEDAWDGAGIEGHMEIQDSGCVIDSSSGTIKMTPLWKRIDGEGKVLELLEGTFTFKVSFGSMYSRKGHGRGQSLTLPFWGVRSFV